MAKTCPITGDIIKQPFELKQCNHQFEKESIREWLLQSYYNTCPICRATISSNDKYHILKSSKKIYFKYIILPKILYVLWYIFSNFVSYLWLFVLMWAENFKYVQILEIFN